MCILILYTLLTSAFLQFLTYPEFYYLAICKHATGNIALYIYSIQVILLFKKTMYLITIFFFYFKTDKILYWKTILLAILRIFHSNFEV